MGDSMAPSLQNGQMFLMDRASPRRQLQSGDVVVLEHEGETLVKRVAAVAGDVLWGIDWSTPDGNPDILLMADEAEDVKDFVLRHPGIGEVIGVEVPSGHVFVVGDAPNSSWDSRQFGAVPVEEVKGRVVLPRHPWEPSAAVLRFRPAVCRAGEP
jgi:signal peptidase I